MAPLTCSTLSGAGVEKRRPCGPSLILLNAILIPTIAEYYYGLEHYVFENVVGNHAV